MFSGYTETFRMWVKFSGFLSYLPGISAFNVNVYGNVLVKREKKRTDSFRRSSKSYAGNFKQSPTLLGMRSISKGETWFPVFKDKKYVFLIILNTKLNSCRDILMMSAQINHFQEWRFYYIPVI